MNNSYNNSYIQDQCELIQKKYQEFQSELNSSGLLNFSDTFFADFPLETLPDYIIEFIDENKNIRKVINQLNTNIGERIKNLCDSYLNNSSVFEGLPVATEKLNISQIYFEIDSALQKVNEATTFVSQNLELINQLAQENKNITQENADLQAQIESITREISHQQFKIDKLVEENSIKDKELQNSLSYLLNNSQKLDSLERLMNEQESASKSVEAEREKLISLLESKIKKLVDSQKININTYENIKSKDVNSQNFYVGIVDLLHYFTFRYVSEIIGNASLLEKYSNNHNFIVKDLLDRLLNENKDFQYGEDILTSIENAQEDSLLIPNNDFIDEILEIKNLQDLKNYLKDNFLKRLLKDKDKLKDLIFTFKGIKEFIDKHQGLDTVENNIKEIDDILQNFEIVLKQYEKNVYNSILLLESRSNFDLADELLKEKYWIRSINIIEKIYKLISEWYFDFKRVDDYLNCVNKPVLIDLIKHPNEQYINSELVKVAEDVKETVSENYEIVKVEDESNSDDTLGIESPKIEAIRHYIDKLVSVSNQSIIDKINKLESFLKINEPNDEKIFLENVPNGGYELGKENSKKMSLIKFNSNKNLRLRLIKSKLIRLKIQTEILRNENYSNILDKLV